jgi:predicted AlkP superfamily phosphohydrolase/phosphomutase
MKKLNALAFFLLLLALSAAMAAWNRADQKHRAGASGLPLRLFWFIPDGLRAEPVTMKVFEWARNGELPNLRRMMDRGAWGYSIPVFPGHTPTNTASLVTGATPKVHGVADGAMRTEGYPLAMVSKNGFSSVAKLVPPIWYTLEENGFHVTLLSMPGSTPPELKRGATIRGRWGGWGVDFPAINFQSRDTGLMRLLGLDHLAFGMGAELTKFSESAEPSGWKLALPASYSPPHEATLESWGLKLHAFIYDSTDDRTENYDRVLFSRDKETLLADLREGERSPWLRASLQWETKNDYNINTPKNMEWERKLSAIPVDTDFNLRVIKLGKKGFFRVRAFYNNLNEYLVQPSSLAGELIAGAGPMVDFVDNYPPQLIYFPEDKKAFLEEADMSLEWHRRALAYLLKKRDTEVVLHNIYTPNQMHTSRWWLSYLDPKSAHFNDVTEEQRAALWAEVKKMYRGIDDILGEALRAADDRTYVVLSSDHGAVPLSREVRLNNLFAKKGWLKFRVDPKTAESSIDWKSTKVAFLQMNSIYVSPGGLAGPYRRASGPEYQKLRAEVLALVRGLRDEGGEAPLERALVWEDAGELGLGGNRVGDIVVANHAGYNWIEEVSEDLVVFKDSLKGGYKQAVIAENEQGMWTPFVIMGPGVKKGFALPAPIRHVDQYPTIMKLLGQEIPAFVEGRPLSELLE